MTSFQMMSDLPFAGYEFISNTRQGLPGEPWLPPVSCHEEANYHRFQNLSAIVEPYAFDGNEVGTFYDRQSSYEMQEQQPAQEVEAYETGPQPDLDDQLVQLLAFDSSIPQKNKEEATNYCKMDKTKTNKRVRKRRLTSQYRGVCWYKRTKRWVVQIRVKGIRKHVGYFKNEVEAKVAYREALHELKKQTASMNTTNQQQS